MAPVIQDSTKLIQITNNINEIRLNNKGLPEATEAIKITNNNNDIRLHEDILHLDKLPEDIQELCNASLKAREAAYAPYSKFYVGAAIRTKDGMITGCNVENASYGLAICAERTAGVKAVSQGYKDFVAVAIGADLENEFCGPCGACRQFLCEFNPEIPIYLVRHQDHMVQITSLSTLLPDSFTPKRTKFEFYNA